MPNTLTNNSRLKAVLFDMDGVITNTMPQHCKIWKKVFLENGISLKKHQIYEREGQTGIKSLQEIFRLYRKPFTRDLAELLLEKKEMLFRSIRRETPFIPYTRTFIRNLHRKGFLLALVTGTSRKELEPMLPESLLSCFSIIVSGDTVTRGKPYPEPYQKALRALHVEAREAIVIENAPYGIASAKSAGIRCLAVQTSLPAKFLAEADHVFSNIREIELFFKKKKYL